jgi:hypothetical protein
LIKSTSFDLTLSLNRLDLERLGEVHAGLLDAGDGVLDDASGGSIVEVLPAGHVARHHQDAHLAELERGLELALRDFPTGKKNLVTRFLVNVLRISPAIDWANAISIRVNRPVGSVRLAGSACA